MSKYYISDIHWIIKIDNTYELLFSYYKYDKLKYGMISSSVNLSYLLDLPELIFQYRFNIINDFSIIIYKYINISKKDIKEYKYGNGEIVVTDYINFLYCKDYSDITDSTVKINIGTYRQPEVIDVEINRYPVLLSIYKNNSCIEIYNLKDNITVIHN